MFGEDLGGGLGNKKKKRSGPEFLVRLHCGFIYRTFMCYFCGVSGCNNRGRGKRLGKKEEKSKNRGEAFPDEIIGFLDITTLLSKAIFNTIF